MRVSIVKSILLSFLIVVISGILGLELMAISFSIPNEIIQSHIKDSLNILVAETDYHLVFPWTKGSGLDNYTEAIYLNEALVSTKDTNILDCILSGNVFESKTDNHDNKTEKQRVQVLADFFESNNTKELMPTCYRFFNGYEVIVKILLLFTNYLGIRLINIIISFALLIVLCLLLYKRGLKKYILPIVISIIFLNPISVFKNMTFVGFYYCMIIPSIIILLIKKDILKKYGWILFEIIGICAFYFNMNYFQLLTFVMPYMIYMLTCGFPDKLKEMLKTLIVLFSCWFIGYAGMMIFKWLIYAVIINPNIFCEMLNNIYVRTSTSGYSRNYGIFLNINVGFSNIWWILMEVLFVIFYIVKYIRNKTKIRINKVQLVLLLIMICMPLCRYFIFANHITLHYWITYRLLMIPILAFNIILIKIENNGQ